MPPPDGDGKWQAAVVGPKLAEEGGEKVGGMGRGRGEEGEKEGKGTMRKGERGQGQGNFNGKYTTKQAKKDNNNNKK